MNNKNKKFWAFKAINEKTGELLLYEEIANYTWYGDEITPKQFKLELDALGDIKYLNIYFNSPGGDVFAGHSIFTILKRHPAYKIGYIDGVAASIASLVAMACDKIIMYPNTMMMIHLPWTRGEGNAIYFRKLAEDLDKVGESMIAAYKQKTGLDEDKIRKIMETESWFTAKDCLELGFADEIDTSKQVAACISEKYLAMYKNIPEILKKPPEEVKNQEEELLKQKILIELEL